MRRLLLPILLVLAAAPPARAERGHRTYQLSTRGRIHGGRALAAFNQRALLPNMLHYGDSIRGLDLRGLTAESIDKMLAARGFRKQVSVIREPRRNRPIRVEGKAIPILIYTHPDGGTVRVKPLGDPTSPYMPQPNAVKTLRWPHDAPGDGFQFEALKVDFEDRALPRRRSELRMQRHVNRKRFLDHWAALAHTDVVPAAPNGARAPEPTVLEMGLIPPPPGHAGILSDLFRTPGQVAPGTAAGE